MALAEFTKTVALTQDTYIRTGATQQSLNYNSDPILSIGVTKITRRIVFSVPIPSDFKHIESATLTLHLSLNDSTLDKTAAIYRLLPSRSGWLEDQATWLSYITGQLWFNGGGTSSSDAHQDIISNVILPSGPSLGAVQLNISEITRAAMNDGESTLHAIMAPVGVGTTGGNWEFATRENAAANIRPSVTFVGLRHPGTQHARKSLNLSNVRGNYIDGNAESSLLPAGRSNDDFLGNTTDNPGGDNFQTKLQPRS